MHLCVNHDTIIKKIRVFWNEGENSRTIGKPPDIFEIKTIDLMAGMYVMVTNCLYIVYVGKSVLLLGCLLIQLLIARMMSLWLRMKMMKTMMKMTKMMMPKVCVFCAFPSSTLKLFFLILMLYMLLDCN